MKFRCSTRGDERIVRRFALFPVRLPSGYSWVGDNVVRVEEVRWLEVVYIRQCWSDWTVMTNWENVEFVPRREYLKYKEEKKNE